MRHTVSRLASRTVAAALAGALALTCVSFGGAQAASPKAVSAAQASKTADVTTDLSARRYYRRGGGNPAAAIAAFGLVAGAIIAAQRRNDYYDRGYGYYGGGYGYGRPYGYGYRHYNRGYRYW